MYKASSFNISPHKYLHVSVLTVAKGGQLLLGGKLDVTSKEILL